MCKTQHRTAPVSVEHTLEGAVERYAQNKRYPLIIDRRSVPLLVFDLAARFPPLVVLVSSLRLFLFFRSTTNFICPQHPQTRLHRPIRQEEHQAAGLVSR